MTAQEQQMLQDLTSRINGTTVTDKDPQAEQFLQQALGRNPDALYILAQTVLVQQYGLDQARQQLDALRNQPPPPTQQPEKHTSFLGNLFGSHDDTPPQPAQNQYSQQGYSPVNQPPPQYGQPQYQQPQYGQPQYGQPQYGQPMQGQPQQGGFLRSAMQTATGVAAGALAFEGIESLFHGFGGGGGGNRGNFGDFGGSGSGGGREEVTNNYYGDSEREGKSRDIEDRRDDRKNFADDASDDNSDSSTQSFDSGNDYDPGDDAGDSNSDDSDNS